MDLSPFTPAGATASLAVTSSTGRVALTQAPTNTTELTVIVYNSGSNDAFVKFGTVSVTATTGNMPVPAGTQVQFSVPNGTAAYIAAITASSTTTLKITSGTGTLYASGGGGSGGAGSSVTIINPVDANGNVKVAIVDSSGTAITYNANVTPADNLANTAGSPVVAFNLVWDGSTWDRAPGTSTTGATVSALPYPPGATPYTATATGTTGATTATLAGASSVTTYICGFSIRANATAATTGNATVTGVITATLNFTQWTAPAASGLGITEMIFVPPVPASGTNQSIAVVSAAPGSGGVVSVTAWGYKL